MRFALYICGSERYKGQKKYHQRMGRVDSGRHQLLRWGIATSSSFFPFEQILSLCWMECANSSRGSLMLVSNGHDATRELGSCFPYIRRI